MVQRSNTIRSGIFGDFFERHLGKRHTSQRDIVLDYSIKHEISEELLSKLTKTQVLYPSDIESMIYWLDALSTLADFFFGDTSLLYKGLDDLIFSYRKNKTLLRRKFCLDEMFIPKLLYGRQQEEPTMANSV